MVSRALRGHHHIHQRRSKLRALRRERVSIPSQSCTGGFCGCAAGYTSCMGQCVSSITFISDTTTAEAVATPAPSDKAVSVGLPREPPPARPVISLATERRLGCVGTGALAGPGRAKARQGKVTGASGLQKRSRPTCFSGNPACVLLPQPQNAPLQPSLSFLCCLSLFHQLPAIGVQGIVTTHSAALISWSLLKPKCRNPSATALRPAASDCCTGCCRCLAVDNLA